MTQRTKSHHGLGASSVREVSFNTKDMTSAPPSQNPRRNTNHIPGRPYTAPTTPGLRQAPGVSLSVARRRFTRRRCLQPPRGVRRRAHAGPKPARAPSLTPSVALSAGDIVGHDIERRSSEPRSLARRHHDGVREPFLQALERKVRFPDERGLLDGPVELRGE